MRSPKRAAILLLGLALAVVVAAASAAADTLERVRQKGFLDVCFQPDSLPFSTREGARQGYEVELAEAVARELGVASRPTWLLVKGDMRLTRCDAAMSVALEETGGAPQAARSSGQSHRMRRALTRAYMRQEQRLVIRDGEPEPGSLAELKDHGGEVGTTHGGYVHKLFWNAGLEVRTYFPTELDVLQAVADGRIVAGAASNVYLGWYRTLHPEARLHPVARLVLDPVLDYPVSMLLRNTDANLLAAVNGALDKLLQDGTIERILGSYGIAWLAPG